MVPFIYRCPTKGLGDPPTWRFMGLLSLAIVFATPTGLTFAKGAPTVFHTGDPADAPSTHDRAAPVSLLGGCGHGRYRDPNTHQCRGPADSAH